MNKIIEAFQVFKGKKAYTTENTRLNSFVDKYYFLYIEKGFEIEKELEIIQNLNNSNVIIINYYKDETKKTDKLHFIISFRKTILIIKQELLSTIKKILLKKDYCEICFLRDTRIFFNQSINIKYRESKKNDFFNNEILEIYNNFYNLKSPIFPYKEFLHQIKLCISGYLIQQSYYDTCSDRIKSYYSNSKIKNIPREMSQDEFIKLRDIGMGSIFRATLFYHIEYEKLCVIKQPNSFDNENEKLLKREISNYEKIKHIFIPKYFGTINNKNGIVIEFINGDTILDLRSKFYKFQISEKMTILLQILSVIEYFHSHNFIYRDLKPNNIIIDKNKNAVVIDFDRMIESKNYLNTFDDSQTADFSSKYAAPEINYGNITNKCDIFSFGQMIIDIISEIKSDQFYSTILSIYKTCIDQNPKKRLAASNLFAIILFFSESKNIIIDRIDAYKQIIIATFYLTFKNVNKAIQYFSLAANQNIPDAQYNLGVIYATGKLVPININKSIHYLSLAANQNHAKAQYNLGLIYATDEYVPHDINKAIHYLSLAANQNHLSAQYNLGIIYEESEYIAHDINKAIHYYSLAANQNDPDAQYNIGVIYYTDEFVSRDINKTIHYYSLAANQKHPEALYNLGLIYYTNEYISQDINKAIHYFSLASNQDHSEAQYNLGVIYYTGEYVPRNLNKSIHYFSLAANQNHPKSLYNLGAIYDTEGKVSRNINKVIHYYSLAADLDDPDAQYNLGLIYATGEYVSRDIKKAIHYLSLAADQDNSDAQYRE